MEPNSINVKLRFGEKCITTRLDCRVDKSLDSILYLRKLIYKVFPPIEALVESSAGSLSVRGQEASVVELKFQDPSGSFTILETDGQLETVMQSKRKEFRSIVPLEAGTSQWPCSDCEISFEIDVKESSASKVVPAADLSSTSTEFEKSKSISTRWRRKGAQSQVTPAAESSYGSPSTIRSQKSKNLSTSFCPNGVQTPKLQSNYKNMEESTQTTLQNLCPEFLKCGQCKHGKKCPSTPQAIQASQGEKTLERRDAIMELTKTKNALVWTDRVLERWLTHHHAIFPEDSVDQLSNTEGLKMLALIAERKSLPNEIINLLVKLLVKDEIRNSHMRHKTNKVYGVLLGSSFLLQLHAHIATHFAIRTPTAQELRPYLLLIEELQSRTQDGWKEVPLDAMYTIVSKLEDNASKIELSEIVRRLIDHRAELQRLLAITPPDKSLRGAAFRQIPIIATKDELMLFQARQDLPVNRVGMQYSSLTEYLETHFQLLREDCIDPLRQGLRGYRSRVKFGEDFDAAENRSQDLRVYSRVEIVGVQCGPSGVTFVLRFRAPLGPRMTRMDFESSKMLMYGALLCISSDEFQTFFWGVVAGRDVTDREKCRAFIRIVGESEDNVAPSLQTCEAPARPYVMVESSTVFFEPYYRVLTNLQRVEMEKIPFTRYLLHLEPRVSPPSYLLRGQSADDYNFTSAFPNNHENLGSIRILQEWPVDWAGSLDRAQQKALKHGLTKELAIIQGPPGTGKTYLGLLLVRILLANAKNSTFRTPFSRTNSSDSRGPILVICFTNHALDQFLEGISLKEENLIRIGGGGKSERLKPRNLKTLLEERRQKRSKGDDEESLHLRKAAKDQQRLIDLSINKHILFLGSELVNREMLTRARVATSQQIESLFTSAGVSEQSAEEIVKVWLNDESADRFSAHHFCLKEEDSSDVSSTSEPVEEEWSPWRVMALPNSERIRAIDEEGGYTAEGRPHMPRRNELGPREGGEFNVGNFDSTDRIDEDDDDWHDGLHPVDEEIRLEDFIDAPDVWELNREQRRILHAHWLEESRTYCRRQLKELQLGYDGASDVVTKADNAIKVALLQKAKVVGMTTTAAAKHYDILKALNTEIVIVEEAAEVLECHILACLNPSVRHLILIGDHVQLRPSVAVHRLATECKLDVSMFERLVRGGVEHVTLQEQRRMRPAISKLVKSLYPGLRDHESVAQYEAVRGVTSNEFFFDHKAEEDQSNDGSASKVNVTEAKLVVGLYGYLVCQGYGPEDVAIITMYSGQLQEIRRLLQSKNLAGTIPQFRDSGPRVSSVDDYQGEESDIIILSLVRSNTVACNEGLGKIGFLKTHNRICVALTRAKKGLFIFGNADLLAGRSVLWKEVTDKLREVGELGPHLELYCQRHVDIKTKISKFEDFKQVEDGGCGRVCESQLGCGHACPKRCHPGSHDEIICHKQCLKQRDECVHHCKSKCHTAENCPPCPAFVLKQLPNCGHQQTMRCSADMEMEVCDSPCSNLLACGHQCRELCGKTCTESCNETVLTVLSCGHSSKRPCHEALESYLCEEEVVILLLCGHSAKLSCHQDPKSHSCDEKVMKTLLCGHSAKLSCHQDPESHSCDEKVMKTLLCGHSVKLPCNQASESYNCDEKVVKVLPCKHSATLSCHRVAKSSCCAEPCGAIRVDCGHRCQGSCAQCKQGTEHTPCLSKCGRILPCGHNCEAACYLPCPPCMEQCRKRCCHGRCSSKCGEMCKPCRRMCAWRCKHQTCEKLCHQVCSKTRCDLPCPKLIRPCGHPCIGLCGERCPKTCRSCHPRTLDNLTNKTLEDHDESDRFIELTDCGHVFEVRGLDNYMDADETSPPSDTPTVVKLKECPACGAHVSVTNRYSNVVKAKQAELDELKKIVNAQDRARQGNRLLKARNLQGALSAFRQALDLSPGLMEAHLGASQALSASENNEKGMMHLRFIVERSSFAVELQSLLQHAQGYHNEGFVEKFYSKAFSGVSDSLTSTAIVQWASSLTKCLQFDLATRLCDFILVREPGNAEAKEVKERASKGRCPPSDVHGQRSDWRGPTTEFVGGRGLKLGRGAGRGLHCRGSGPGRGFGGQGRGRRT